MSDSRHHMMMAHRFMDDSNAYGPAGNAKGEPGHEAKTQAIFRAIMQGIQDGETHRQYLESERPRSSLDSESTSRKVIAALAEAGFRITKAPAKR